MIRVGGRFRKTVGLLVWFVIIFGLIQEGSALGIKHYLSAHWAFSGVLNVRLLFFKASSPQGEIVVNTVPIRWKKARYSPFGGLSIGRLTVGSREKPAAVIKNLRMDDLRPLLSGVVSSACVRVLDPAWRKLAAASRGEKKTHKPFSMPVDIDIERLELDAPGGEWSGRASVSAAEDGTAGTFELHAKGPQGLNGILSGNWEAGAGECFFRLASPRKIEASLDFRWKKSGFLLAADYSGKEGRFGIDASGLWNESADILLWNKMEDGRFTYMSTRVIWNKRTGLPEPAVDIQPGVVTLPKLTLGKKAWFSGGKLAVDFPANPRKLVPSGVCLRLEGILHVEKTLKGYTRRVVLNLNYDAGGGGTPVPSPSENPSGLTRFRKERPTFVLSGRAERIGRHLNGPTGRKVEPSAAFTASGEIGRSLGFKGRARIEGLRTEFSGKVEKFDWKVGGKLHWNAVSSVRQPLGAGPAFPLNGFFSLSGDGLELRKVELIAHGSGAWKLSLSKETTVLAVRNASFYADGTFVRGLDGEVSLCRASATRKIRCDLKAQEIDCEGTRLTNSSLKGGGGLGNMGFDFGVSLPQLEGEARGKIAARVAPGSIKGRLSRGTVSMMKKNLIISGLSTDWMNPNKASFRWKADNAEIWGERVRGISGRLNAGDGNGGGVIDAAFPVWSGSGKVQLKLNAGKKTAPTVYVSLKKVELAPVGKFIKNWVELPLEIKKGKGNGAVELPLENLPEGIAFSVTPNEADLDLGEGDFYGVSGTFSGRFAGGTLKCSSSGMSLEKGKVPVAIRLVVKGEEAKLSFDSSETDLESLQNAVFDFLPEYLAYGKMSGRGSAHGAFRYRGGIATLKGVIRTVKGAFTSEDGSLVIRGVEGSLPVSLAFGEGLKENRVVPEAGIRGKDYKLAVRKVAYSVFTIRGLRVESHLTGRKLVALLNSGRLWGGKIGGELSLRILKGDIAYSGKIKLKGLSLWEFCRESRSLEGALSGQFSGTLKIQAPTLGMGNVKGLLDIKVDKDSKEKKRISRDFIVRLGGGRIRLVLKSHVLTYDKASLKCGLDNGVLTFYNLELSHLANPLKSIMRKDISFELRIPRDNSVSVWKLIEQIKKLEGEAGADGHAGKKKQSVEGNNPVHD